MLSIQIIILRADASKKQLAVLPRTLLYATMVTHLVVQLAQRHVAASAASANSPVMNSQDLYARMTSLVLAFKLVIKQLYRPSSKVAAVAADMLAI